MARHLNEGLSNHVMDQASLDGIYKPIPPATDWDTVKQQTQQNIDRLRTRLGLDQPDRELIIDE